MMRLLQALLYTPGPPWPVPVGRLPPAVPAPPAGNGGPPDTLIGRINGKYDRQMFDRFVEEYYEHSGFHNFGYWAPGVRTQREASENLVDQLLALLPRKGGTILDVACGLGATTKRLLRQYAPEQVTGINISEKQLAACRARAPGCTFRAMDATRLDFPDESFDSVLCVEAVFHFDTRERFLREALRVLKPGGGLALSDVLLRSREVAANNRYVPPANYVPDRASYEALYPRAGFQDVRTLDATGPCWKQFRDHCLRYVAGRAGWGALRWVSASLDLWDFAIRSYLLVGARKPPEPAGRGRRSRAR
jgi:ubiquinone/menaquinone biosynthesis C-methylase UbiE